MSQGVEHRLVVKTPSFATKVNDSEMPKGVEHQDMLDQHVDYGTLVNGSQMSQGVEHTSPGFAESSRPP
jgi:hypothetical protein